MICANKRGDRKGEVNGEMWQRQAFSPFTKTLLNKVLKEMGFELVGWIQLAEHIDRFQALTNTVMNSDSIG